MFYLTTHLTHFIYGYMASAIWLRTILIVRKETRCHHMGYSFRLAARVLLYASSHRQDNTYHSLCYTSCGALAGMRNSSIGPPWRIDPTTHHTMSVNHNKANTNQTGVGTVDQSGNILTGQNQIIMSTEMKVVVLTQREGRKEEHFCPLHLLNQIKSPVFVYCLPYS